MKAKLLAAFLCAQLLVAPRAFASASILGFSVGEENYTLAGILTQAIQQVQVLNDIANVMKSVKDDIAFVKDVYGTANDIANANWNQLSQDLVSSIINSDPNLREIYNDTQEIVANRVPQGDSFRRLLNAGMSDFIFHAFGPYPFGNRGQVYAYTDVRALSINTLVEQQSAALQMEHKAVQQAWQECQKNPGSCERSQAALQMNADQILSQIKQTENQRALLEAHRALVESGEKRQREAGTQQDLSQIAGAMHVITGTSNSSNTLTVGASQ